MAVLEGVWGDDSLASDDSELPSESADGASDAVEFDSVFAEIGS
jgi:hypothetical protein